MVLQKHIVTISGYEGLYCVARAECLILLVGTGDVELQRQKCHVKLLKPHALLYTPLLLHDSLANHYIQDCRIRT